ncbi:MAG: hypothetical protein AB7O04_04425 [Hyphomonadaceae bacterium]
MVGAWVGAFLAAAIAAFGARAQTASEGLQFRERPSFEDIEAHYPEGARRANLDGRVLLCCLPRENGTLSCAAVGEAPLDFGFGEAARRVSQAFRLTPDATEALRARGGPIRLPINFRSGRGVAAPAFAREPRCGTRTGNAIEDDAPPPQTYVTEAPNADAQQAFAPQANEPPPQADDSMDDNPQP